ncbi:MAG TPA: DUF1016 N-terminal domain-containing protein [Gammaproteobacteria bacterium]|jgi:hypothetical protein|nr:DUF1016 N-terminal domain-containing protein [Gammaproteobacteria bacterium]
MTCQFLNGKYIEVNHTGYKEVIWINSLQKMKSRFAQIFTQQSAARLPWSQIQLLLDKFKDDPKRRAWYAQEAVKNGWSRYLNNLI